MEKHGELEFFDLSFIIAEAFALTNDPKDGRYLYEEKDGCGKSLAQSLRQGRIVGGEDAKIGELPFMALLGYHKAELGIVYQCGGTLINRFVSFVSLLASIRQMLVVF